MARTIGTRRRQEGAGRFVGRSEEQRRFRATLSQLAALRGRSDDDLTDDELGYAQIFLVAAEGGMGKTTLLRRFEQIVREDKDRADSRVLYLDLERHAPIADADMLMRILHDALCEIGLTRELQPYRDALMKRAETQRKAADAEERFKSLGNLGGKAVQLATGGIVDKDLAAEGIHAGARWLAELREFIRKRLDPDEWQLYDDPIEGMTDALMAALNGIATAKRPLVLLLDTYELADHCDNWLRGRALPQSNPRLVWVIAGRAGQPFIQRYEDTFGASLVGGISLGTFARPDVIAYLSQVGIAEPPDELVDHLQALSRGIPLALEGWFNLYQKNVELPPPDPAAPTTRREIVRTMTDRFLRYCNEDDKHLAATERRAREEVRNHILTLMLLRRISVDALTAAWQCDAERAEALLNDLADQFSFVFAQEIEREPHALVKEFLREHLRGQPELSAAVRNVVTRLVTHFEGHMRERERVLAPEVAPADASVDEERAALIAERAAHQRRRDQLNIQLADYGLAAPPHIRTDRDDAARAISSIDTRLAENSGSIAPTTGPRRPLWADTIWRETLLDLVNLLCWADRSGERVMRLVVPMFVEALEFEPNSAAGLLLTVEEFAERWPPERQRLLVTLIAGFDGVSWNSKPEAIQAIVGGLQSTTDIWRLTSLQCAILSLHYGRSLLMGRYDMTSEDRAAAMEAVDEAAQLLPADGGELAQALANVYQRVGRACLWPKLNKWAVKSPEAVRMLAAATHFAPTNHYAWSELGTSYLMVKEYDAATAAYRQAITLAPTSAYAYTGLGNVYRNRDEYEAAITAYQQAIALDPTNAIPHYQLGTTYRILQKYDAAITALQQVITLDPNFDKPYAELGIVYRDLKKYDEAIPFIQQAITFNPDSVFSYHSLGLVYADTARYDDAIAMFQQAIAIDPFYKNPYNGLGFVYRYLKRYDEAITLFQKAIDLDPTFMRPYNNLGAVYSLLDRNEEAAMVYQQVLKLNPADHRATLALARIARLLEQQTELAVRLDQAQVLLPPDDFYNLACLESIAGNVDAAVAALKTALEHGSSVESARDDPDFVFIRDDPRYRALVGLADD